MPGPCCAIRGDHAVGKCQFTLGSFVCHLIPGAACLRLAVQAFGRVASCRLVLDKASGRLKGTAFVDFAEPQAAHKAAEACAKAR